MLLDGDYFVLHVDDAEGLVVLYRTPTPFASIEGAEQALRAVALNVQPLSGKSYGLLVDSRAGPGRNDEAFERMLARYRGEIFGCFTRRAVLVQTTVGLMQVQRLHRQHADTDFMVFQDEAHARLFLRSGPDGTRRA